VAEGNTDFISAFIRAGCVPRDAGHASGTLDEAERLRATHPDLSSANIYSAAVLGDAEQIRRFIRGDRSSATTLGGPYNWDALTHLCFSRYLRLDPNRSAGFVSAATALLDAGASANTGFYEHEHQPRPEFESALYGACGIAHHAELTRLLVERGADVNDGEVTYHTPESYDNRALQVLLSSGRVTPDSLGTMLLRKADLHDSEGVKILLAQGADPNRMTHWGYTALHQSVQRDNRAAIVEALLSHNGDPTLLPKSIRSPDTQPRSAVALAARRGRGDLLDLFSARGFADALQGVDALLAACAQDRSDRVEALVRAAPQLRTELHENGAIFLAQFAGNGNTHGVRHLLDLGVDIRSIYPGDRYFGIAPNSTALHVAAWRARPTTVQLLLERGAPVNPLDGEGRTALQLAVLACVASFWKERRSPESVEALLRAGASVAGVEYPSGYAEVDELLKAHGAPG
jgi:ankyrin repeat protein